MPKLKPAFYQLTLDITVEDFAALRRAAKQHALKFMSAADWKDLRNCNRSPVAADIHMLLDPGTSPDGLQIEHGSVTFVDGNLQDR